MESAKLKKSQKAATGPAEAEETEALLQSKHSQTGPLLRMFWSMFGTYFLLSTVCLVICDVFLFSTPKVLRYEHIYNIFLSHVHELRGVVCQHRHTNNDLLKFSHADKRSSGVICAKPSQVRRKRHKAVTISLEQELFDASIHHITLPLAVVSRLRAPWLMKSTAVHPTHLK